MAEKRKRIVNTLFITLVVVTLVLGFVLCVLDFLSYEDYGNDAKYLYAFAVLIYPILAVLILGNEVFLWRCVAFFAAYPGRRKVELVIRIPMTLVSATHFGYWVYCLFANPADNLRFPVYAFGFQILCQLLIWIYWIIRWTAECIVICRQPIGQDEVEQ